MSFDGIISSLNSRQATPSACLNVAKDIKKLFESMLYSRTTYLLDRLEAQLKSSNMWTEQAPSEQAMASSVPFACDQMSFDAWLQFIFLPRMRLLIDNEQPLPTSIALSPMAEQVWLNRTDLVAIISVLNQLDTLLNDA